MAYHVEITRQAEHDAEAILDWLVAEHGGRTSIAWFIALDEAFASLSKFPERCPFAPESQEFDFEVRQLVYGRKPNVYRILFTIEGNTIHVLHIRHGKRRPVK